MHGWHLLGGISGSKRVGLTLDSERGGGSFIVSTRVWSWGRGGGSPLPSDSCADDVCDAG